jgi:hypothetical protein
MSTDPSMPEKYAGGPTSKLWERQGPMTELDDGTGPYTFCQWGNSHCIDSFCPCKPSIRYRLMYWYARSVTKKYQKKMSRKE